MTLASTNLEIRSAFEGHVRRRAEALRVRHLIRAVDEVLEEVEAVNLRGGKVVPTEIRQRAVELVVALTGERPEHIPARGARLLDTLYDAQERLLREKNAGLPVPIEDEELDPD